MCPNSDKRNFQYLNQFENARGKDCRNLELV